MLRENGAHVSHTLSTYVASQALNAQFVKMESLEASRQRMVNLRTYSSADTTKFLSRESFSAAIVEAWQHFGIRILHWVACIEVHSNNNCAGGNEMNLYHFHMAVKLAKKGRWLQMRIFWTTGFKSMSF